jgi:hypothetical protein
MTEQETALRQIDETAARSAPGVRVLVAGGAALLGAIVLYSVGAASHDSGIAAIAATVLLLAGLFAMQGLTP